LPALSLAALGVVFGDIGTSPLGSYGVSHVTIGRLQGPVLRPFEGYLEPSAQAEIAVAPMSCEND
jgi:hypothetical protein